MIEINYLAVLVAAIANAIVGSIWFGPLFGKTWMAMLGITKEQMAAGSQKEVVKSYVIMFIGSLVMAFVLSHMITFASAYMGTSGVAAGLTTGFWVWLGFVVPVTTGVVLWEGKSWRYWAVTYTYYLVALLVMGAILASWR